MDQQNPDFLKSVRDFANSVVDTNARLARSYVHLWSPAPAQGTQEQPPSAGSDAARHALGYIDATARYYREMISLAHSYASTLSTTVQGKPSGPPPAPAPPPPGASGEK